MPERLRLTVRFKRRLGFCLFVFFFFGLIVDDDDGAPERKRIVERESIFFVEREKDRVFGEK